MGLIAIFWCLAVIGAVLVVNAQHIVMVGRAFVKRLFAFVLAAVLPRKEHVVVSRRAAESKQTTCRECGSVIPSATHVCWFCHEDISTALPAPVLAHR